MADLEPFDPGFGPLVDTTVRVATWNLWATYAAWQIRGPIIEAQLRAAAPDIALLVEAWAEPTGRSQAEGLAVALGDYEHVWASNLTFADGVHAGNAILSRWPIVRSEVRTLPREAPNRSRDDEGEERLCVFAEIDGPRGLMQVFCAHLSWREDHGAIRQEQVRAIAEFARETRPRAFPAILGGDLNAAPDTDEIRFLAGKHTLAGRRTHYQDAYARVGGHRGPGFTWARANTHTEKLAWLERDRRIDYIFVSTERPDGRGKILDARVVMDSPDETGLFASDHFGVMADVQLKPLPPLLAGATPPPVRA